MSEQEKIARVEQQALRDHGMVMHRSLFGYLYDLLTHTSLYAHWRSLLAFLRRFRAVTLTLKVLTVLFSVIETGALVILSTVIFLIILPVLTAFMLGVLLTAFLESRRTNQRLASELSGKRVYVLFMREGDPNLFLSQNARELATHGTVLLVSPYWISARGLYPHGFYCTVRREAPQILLVRRYYFFSLRRHVLSKIDTAYLY